MPLIPRVSSPCTLADVAHRREWFLLDIITDVILFLSCNLFWIRYPIDAYGFGGIFTITFQ